ncbi:MAG TPA: DUF4358 domain-containing protein [Oscillospiraceae bacterium]|nr:DUF4358 domain-containing protein [Oscillospiraceae bacterium]
MKKILCFLFAVLSVAAFAGCSTGSTPVHVDLNAVMKDMKSQVTFTDTIDLTKDDLNSNYGIKSEDVKQFAAIADTTGIKADELVMIEGKNADSAKRIKAALDSRYQEKINANISYLPEQYAIIKKCSVRQNGNYVSMLVSPDAEKIVKIYNGYMK